MWALDVAEVAYSCRFIGSDSTGSLVLLLVDYCCLLSSLSQFDRDFRRG
jgi:hypothetical protein